MSQKNCTDVCDIVLGVLGALGFKFTDDEDHTDMIEMLAQCKLMREHTPDKEKIWSLWDLTGTVFKG